MLSVLFDPQSAVEAISKPEFSLANINQILKYYTHQILWQKDPFTTLKLICIVVAISFTLKNIFVYIKRLLVARVNLTIVKEMRNTVYSHILRLPVSYYDRNKAGRLTSLFVNDISIIRDSLTKTFNAILMEPVRIIGYIFLLIAINPMLTLIILILFPLHGFFIAKIGSSVRRRSKRSFEKLSGLLAILTETIRGIRVVKMFNMNDVEVSRFNSENQKFVKNAYKAIMASSMSGPIVEVLGVIAMVALLWFGGHLVLSDSGFDPEDFIRFLGSLFLLFKPIKTLGNTNNSLQQGMAGAERVFKILDTVPEKLLPQHHTQSVAFNSSIRFSHVSFQYPDTTEIVLRDISFTIKKGEIVALVGSSGSGKSTILDIIPRFYEITQGAVTIDDVDIRSLSLLKLRNLFGIVAQETVLFNDTIFNNIAYGTEHASLDAVRRAAEAANAISFIQEMPHQFDTVVGEHGAMLSGGQRQRLAIARALLRNPPILILDEATSALDTESEVLVQNAINNLMANRTVLVVAHRLSTITHADKIIVLENGEIIESGTHEELLSKDKRYRQLYSLQSNKGNT